MNYSRRCAFTIIELLIVLAIVGILAALLFPAFAQARARSRAAVCTSNLRQLGMVVHQYAADYDDYLPEAVDPSDKILSFNYSDYPQFEAMIPDLPNIMDALSPYTRSDRLWHCPADTGYDTYDATGQPLNGRPTSFAAIGTSYFYRTQLTYDYMKPTVLSPSKLGSLHHPADTDVLYDASSWHSGAEPEELRRYNVVYADGHVQNILRCHMVWIQNQPL